MIAVAGYHGAVPDAVVLARGRRLLRSKSLDRNSYDSGDWFNTLDWTGKDNGFGHGLPLKADNENKWPYMKPLLEKPALKPTADDVQAATAQAQDLLCGFQFAEPAVPLGSAEAINAKVSFPASGTADARGRHRDADRRHAGRRRRPGARGPARRVQRLRHGRDPEGPRTRGAGLALSVQAQGSDAVVKAATWDAATGSATVPARTVAVFLQR